MAEIRPLLFPETWWDLRTHRDRQTHPQTWELVVVEVDIALQNDQVENVGLLLFTFGLRPNYFLEVHVCQTFSLTGLKVFCSKLQLKEEWY